MERKLRDEGTQTGPLGWKRKIEDGREGRRLVPFRCTTVKEMEWSEELLNTTRTVGGNPVIGVEESKAVIV